MNIGELFLNLGVKGTDKTVGALGNVKKGLGETASMSLEAKAGILAAMYALERLVSISGAAGTGLTNFNALTGLSMKQLQQWQYAARQAGVSNEEFTGSLKAVQTSMTNMLLGKGAPEGLAMLANKVGFDPKRARDTFYVLEQLQKFAKTVPNDIGNSVMKSFGVSDGTIAAMRRQAFRPEVMSKAPMYNDQEIGSLDRANIAWSNLGNKIEMAIGHFNAMHGESLVKDFTMLTNSAIKFTEALVTLADKLKIFTIVSTVIDGLAGSMSDVTGWMEGKRSFWGEELDEKGKVKGERSLTGKTLGNATDFFSAIGKNKAGPGLSESPYGKMGVGTGAIKPAWAGGFSKSVTPAMKATAPDKGSAPVTVNQNLNFKHEGKDAKKVGTSVKKANQEAYRQFNQGRVN